MTLLIPSRRGRPTDPKLKNSPESTGIQLGDKPPEKGKFSTSGLLATADWTDFRCLDSLPRKGGVSVNRLPALVAKEVTDNALDAAGNASIDLVGPNGFRVTDTGPGIDLDDAGVADLFSIGRPRRSSKLWRRPDRGALGNGLRVVAGAALATGGFITVSTRGRTLRLAPRDDGSTGYEVIGEYHGDGTVVEVQLGRRLPVDEGSLEWAREAIGWAGQGKSYKGGPSPHWFSEAAFFELCQTQPPDVTVHRFVQKFDGCSCGTAGPIAGHFAKGQTVCGLTRDQTGELLGLAREASEPVFPHRLGSLGKPASGTPYAKVETHLDVGGAKVPAVIEIYGAPAARSSAAVLVNRTPVVGEAHAGIQKEQGGLEFFVQGCGLNAWVPVPRTQTPCRLTLSVLAPAVPLTSDGKSPDLGSAEEAIEAAVARVLKKVKKLAPAGTAEKAAQKAVIFAAILVAAFKASGGWKARFSIRQLFYNVRPAVLLRCGKELSYGYFCRVVTAYENKRGRVRLMYRDPRGVIIHPHTGEQIHLGTLAVENYKRPAWNFNKVLYVEKKGFFPALIEAKFGERYDCALMSSDGYATGAVRDLLDLLDGHDEAVTIYCIHDADAYGTGIFQALQDETETRAGPTFKVIDLGLNPDEAFRMAGAGHVEVERLKGTGTKRKPVARYVAPEWADWLQSNRVELNAMSTPFFLEWLESKFAACPGKVIPPAEIMTATLAERVRADVREITIRKFMAEEGDALVERAVAERAPRIEAVSVTIIPDVTRALAESPQYPWTEPVARIALSIAKGDGPDPISTV